VIADGSDKELTDGVPDHGGDGVAIGSSEGIGRALDISTRTAGAVSDAGEMPGGAAVCGVVEALIAGMSRRGVDESGFIGLADGGNDELRAVGAPSEGGEAFADEGVVLGGETGFEVGGLLNEAPRLSVVGGAKNAGAVVGVEGIVGVAEAGEENACATGLDRDGADAEADSGLANDSRLIVCDGREDGSGGSGILTLPDASAGGAEIDGIAGKVGGIESDGGDAAGDEAIVLREDGEGAGGSPSAGGGGDGGSGAKVRGQRTESGRQGGWCRDLPGALGACRVGSGYAAGEEAMMSEAGGWLRDLGVGRIEVLRGCWCGESAEKEGKRQ